MNPEFYQYVKELHSFIEYQAKKLKKVEQQVLELKQEISSLKDRPPVQVGNIEYKFDQLKVETLEGTLNIGLNPSDLEGMSDFTVDNKDIQVPPISPKNLFRESMEIENGIQAFLDSDLPQIFNEAKAKLNFNVDDSYLEFIRGDILKQLPTRIDTHLKNSSSDQRNNEEIVKDLIERLKAEIQQGVYLFLTQLHDQQGKKEE